MIPSEVTIQPGDDRSCFTSQSIIDDTTAQEPDEDFTLVLDEVIPSDPRVVIPEGTTTVTILDDDGEQKLYKGGRYVCMEFFRAICSTQKYCHS